jgi:hypothetical protein
VLGIAALIAGLADRFRSGDGPDVPLVIAFTMLTLFMTGHCPADARSRPHRPHRQVPALPGAGRLHQWRRPADPALRPAADDRHAGSAHPLTGFPDRLAGASPWTLLVSVFTLFVALRPPRVFGQAPPLLVALLAGTSLHLLLSVFIEPGRLSGSLGHLEPRLPDLDVMRSFGRILTDPELRARSCRR